MGSSTDALALQVGSHHRLLLPLDQGYFATFLLQAMYGASFCRYRHLLIRVAMILAATTYLFYMANVGKIRMSC